MKTKFLAVCETENEKQIIGAVFSRKGTIRTSKPFSVEKTDSTETAVFKGCANYAWRMIAFDFSGYGKNSCMPVTADFDLGAALYKKWGCNFSTDTGRAEYRAEFETIRAALDLLVKRVESTVPVTMQAGAMRWGRALGMIA
jgi:hypothetical protein